MSERGEELAAGVMTTVHRAAGITKSAGGPVDVRIVQAVVEAFSEMQAMFEAHTSYVGLMLEAIDPGPPPRQVVPYRPDQWRTGLIPAVPPQQMNGHGAQAPGPEGVA